MFLALLALAVVIGIFIWAKDNYNRQQAKPFEEVQNWSFDLKDTLGVEAHARTKLVSNTLLTTIEIIGYPKHFSDSRNTNAFLIFDFLDEDGFKITSKSVKISEFTNMVDSNGEKAGLSYQFDEYLDQEQYKRFNQMQVSWNLLTKAEPLPAPPITTLDHCAPNISKTERLKRLAQYGTVRQTGEGQYSAGEHSVDFFTYDGSLINCR